MYNMTQHELRQFYLDLWKKHHEKIPLEPLETQLLEIMQSHPEYFKYFNDPDSIDKDFMHGTHNPFLHMSLHMALREQSLTDRPHGIALVYEKLLMKYQGDVHQIEHLMIEILEAHIPNMSAENSEQNYLLDLQKLL